MDKARLDAIKAVKQSAQAKDKPWKNLPASEKDKLLEAVCRMLGLYGGN